jgi:hypothetical protein
MENSIEFRSSIAKADHLDHIPPVKLTFIYFSIDHEINAGDR